MCDVDRPPERSEHDPESDRPVEVGDLVDDLVVAVTNRRIFRLDHPRVRRALESLERKLKGYALRSRTGRFELECADGCLYWNDRPLVSASASASRIIEAIERIDSGGIALSPDATLVDLGALVDVLVDRKITGVDHEIVNQSLARRGCDKIRFLPAHETEIRGDLPSAAPASVSQETLGSVEIPRRLYQRANAILQDVMVAVIRGGLIPMDEALGYVDDVVERLNQDAATMLRMGRYQQFDRYTFGHSIGVCHLALHFAKAIGVGPELRSRIGMAAFLHDVGKARVPDEILFSTKRLSDDERREMNQHTVYGAETLLAQERFDPLAVAIAFGHHRQTLGRGYPETVLTPRLSSATRLIQICDVYEALTSVRPYKPPMSPTRAYRIMMAEDRFDRPLLSRFIRVNGVYPDGARVRLTTGELARVNRQTGDVLRPKVVIETTPDGDPIPISDRERRNLTESDEARPVAELMWSEG